MSDRLPTQSIPIWPRIQAEIRSADGAILTPSRVVVPGSRVLALGTAGDQSRFVDLPVGAAIKAPSTLNPHTGDVQSTHPHTSWYADQLREAFAGREHSAKMVPTVSVRKACRNIVIVNCIDHLYGHCLLKLLNCDYHHDRDPETGICVLIQPQMRNLVPDYVAEIWEVPISLADGVRWFDSVDQWVDARIRQYDAVSISRAYSHLSKQYYDIRHFAGPRLSCLDALTNRSPIIHFSCRSDRCWGCDANMQEKRLRRLYFQLRRRYERLALVITGFGKPNRFARPDDWNSGWIDLRTEQFDVDVENQWLSAMAVSDIAVGVHGSNMLLPTAFAPSAVIMLPLAKYDGIGLDTLMPPQPLLPRDEMLSYSFVYGDEDLLDIDAKTLAKIIANKMGYSRINREWFRFGPDFNDDRRLQELLADKETVSAVHRVERNHLIGRIKSRLRRSCIRMAAALE